MNEVDSEFDDPTLRAAIQRTMGGGIAPPALRWKVASMLSESAAAVAGSDVANLTRTRQVIPPSYTIGESSRFKTYAAAAVMLIAVGVMVMQIRSVFVEPVVTTQATVSPIVSAMVEMVHTHDQCAKLNDHHLIAGDDLAALSAKLSAEEQIPVFAASLGSDWQFRGAGICPIGEVRAAHLLFVRADEVVSVFSFPSPQFCESDSSGDYHQTIEHHPVAGVRRGGAMYCVVGSRATGEMNPSEIEPVLTKITAAMASGDQSDIRPTFADATPSH